MSLETAMEVDLDYGAQQQQPVQSALSTTVSGCETFRLDVQFKKWNVFGVRVFVELGLKLPPPDSSKRYL